MDIQKYCLLTLCLSLSMVLLGAEKPNAPNNTKPSLKCALSNQFYFGTALSKNQYLGLDAQAQSVVKEHFNAIVTENCMKSEKLQPKQGQFFFDDADKFVEFGEQNNLHITGHTLIWHSQTPDWFFVDENGEDVTREELIGRMKTHIHTVVGRYKGRVKGWDVVNEAILDDGSWRKSKFYSIIGPEFIKLAFEFAHEVDSSAELYYNDYSMALPKRRDAVVNMVKDLQKQGIKISGIGMQGHVDLITPSITEFEKSILAFSELGVDVMITEFDMSALPSPWNVTGANVSDTIAYQERMNPYRNGLSVNTEVQWENRMLDFFKLFIKHSNKISRVTLWGVNDSQSWKNDFPIKGRTDYPLLFDRNFVAKPVVWKIVQLASVSNDSM